MWDTVCESTRATSTMEVALFSTFFFLIFGTPLTQNIAGLVFLPFFSLLYT